MKNIKLYLPIKASKIVGFWVGNEGKIYKDYLQIVRIKKDVNLEKIRQQYQQEALFYIDNNQAVIYSNKGSITLRNKIIFKTDYYKNIDLLIKYLLKKYNGLTYFKNLHKIEVWY